jgi:hypothetical protein
MINPLNEKTRNSLQYQGYLETENIFTTENNPFSQNLFFLSSSAKPTNITIKENLMLGKRVEEFFKLQVQTTDSYEIIIENIQIQKNKRTIGELDFILKENTNGLLKHVEVSYKFYLFDPTIAGSEIEKWIGPNRNDDLLKKITKLSNHQFPLLYTNEATNQLGIYTNEIQQEVFFKAQLYIPYHLALKGFEFINTKAIRGTYISYKDFIISAFREQELFIPKKQDWLISPKENTTWYSYDVILEIIAASIQLKKSPLVWTKSNIGNVQSLFVCWW